MIKKAVIVLVTSLIFLITTIIPSFASDVGIMFKIPFGSSNTKAPVSLNLVSGEVMQDRNLDIKDSSIYTTALYNESILWSSDEDTEELSTFESAVETVGTILALAMSVALVIVIEDFENLFGSSEDDTDTTYEAVF